MQNQYEHLEEIVTKTIASLGAIGVALQNYTAMVLFMKDVLPASVSLNKLIHIVSFTAGGLCSGWVNLLLNIDLLKSFFKRILSHQEKILKLSNWQWIQYYAGIVVFVVTGILFGLMAFTFALEGALATLSIAAGIFVAAIMTIQEVETWISSYEDTQELQTLQPLSQTQQLGAWFGYITALGNVMALSLLFTLSLAQSLMMLNCSVILSWTLGAGIAFTFGAFTEYFFYQHYLSSFCKDFSKHWEQMMVTPNWGFGLACILTNAIVNSALTYAGVALLFNQLATIGLSLPVWSLIPLTGLIACFAGTASFILGLNFWTTPNETPQISLSPCLNLN